MAKDRISQLYERHKSFPRGRNSEQHPAPRSPRSYDASPRDGALRNNAVQDIESAHDEKAHYTNDVPISDWKRNGRAETKPGYDQKNAYRVDRDTGMRDQIKIRSADFNRHHTEFTFRHNAGETQSPDRHDFSKRHITEAEKRLEMGIYKSDRPAHRGKWTRD
jgi:hypothetical protein